MFFLLFASLHPAHATPPAPELAVADDDEADDDDDDLSRGFSEIAGELGLSAEQKTKIEQIFYEGRLARVDQKARFSKARLELRHQLMGATVDEKSVNRSLEAMVAADAELTRAKVKLILDLRKLLTAEQFDELLELRKQSRSDRREKLRERLGTP